MALSIDITDFQTTILAATKSALMMHNSSCLPLERCELKTGRHRL